MKIYDMNDDYSYTLGMSITIELLQNHPLEVIEVYYSSKIYLNDYFNKLKDLCLKYNIPLIEDDKVINKLSVKENCYVVAYFKKFYPQIDKKANHVILYNIKDEGNFGTILRTCISFNMQNIILIDNKIDYFHPRIVRSSMGSIFYCHFERYNSLEEYKKLYNHQLYSYSNKANVCLNDIQFDKPYSIVFSDDNLNDLNMYNIKTIDDTKIPLPLVCGITLSYLYAKD